MLGSHALEVGIGLALLFLFVSLICTAIREMIEAVLKSRAMDLERGIRTLLNDKTGTGFAQTFWAHPLISSLFAGDYDPRKLTGYAAKQEDPTKAVTFDSRMPAIRRSGWSLERARSNLPSYVPAAQFAAALVDILGRGATHPDNKPGSDEGASKNIAATSTPLDPVSFARLRETVTTIQDNAKLRGALLAAIDGAQGDVDKIKANLEQWYNGTMDRVAGWYKRRTQIILFFLGLGAAVFFNIDAITIATHLAREQALQTSVLDHAEKLITAGKNADQNKSVEGNAKPSKLSKQEDQGGVSGGQAPETPDSAAAAAGQASPPPRQASDGSKQPGAKEADDTGGGPNGSTGAANIGSTDPAVLELSKQSLRELTQGLKEIDYPIGWEWGWPKPQAASLGCPELPATDPQSGNAGDASAIHARYKACRQKPVRIGPALSLLLGWLVTAFAVTLGAPFWFDVLNKFMVIRSTVKPYEKSGDKGSDEPGGARAGNDANGKKPPKGRSGDGGGGASPTPPDPSIPSLDAFHTDLSFEPHQWNDSNPLAGVL